MLRTTFFAAAALICSTQAYAVMYLARPYEPNMARWLTRDPMGEDGGPNLYGFVANDPINEVDDLGLCKTCTCKSVKITYFPGGDKWQADFYSVGGSGAQLFGTVFIITWTVDGDPTQCRYFLNEPAGGVTGTNPNGQVGASTGTGGQYQELFTPVYRDHTGIPFVGNGKYKVKYKLTQTYKCEDSDGTPMEVGPKTYKKTFTAKWPKK